MTETVTDFALKRLILEMGTGNDLYGEDYTKAAIRAVQDAIHHSSLTLFKTLELDPQKMEIELTIAVQEPEKVDLAAVAQEMPYGNVHPKAVKGGLNIPSASNEGFSIIANAGIVVRYPLPV